MSAKNTTRVLALLAVLAMVAAACGQKEGVHVGFAGGAGAGATGSAGGFVDADGDGVDDNTNLSAEEFNSQFGGGGSAGGTDVAAGGGGDTSGAATGGSGGSSGGSTTAGTASGGGSGGSGSGGGSGGGGGGGGGSTGPGDSTGVTDSTIKIGIHAPLTGAAPIPSESFRSGKDQYWKRNKVAGRTVEVVFRDDEYNPSTASQVCQELILKEKVFLLTGSGGTDQIATCARVAAQHGVPYLSAGVTERGLSDLDNYWTLSQGYSQQMPLLMQLIKKEIPKPAAGKLVVGLIASNTANFDDAVAAYEKAARAAGFEPKVYRPSKEASTGELQGVATRMAGDNVAVGTPVMAPTQWIELISDQRIRDVEWRGIGLTQGLNTVANAGCKSSANAIDEAAFFSPWPGFNMHSSIDPKFEQAGGSDDIQWGLWGLNKTLHAAFSKMGNNLTREAFNKAMTGGVRSGVYPDLAHTASNHFRATSVHVVRADCSRSQFVSQKSDLFRKGF